MCNRQNYGQVYWPLLAHRLADIDALGDDYEYLIGQFAAGSGKKTGEFYTPQQISDILSAIVTLDSQEPKTGKKNHLASVLDFACGPPAGSSSTPPSTLLRANAKTI
jgi:type I restriction-modification system DNA methylase subunit